jgi:hypothetical protein
MSTNRKIWYGCSAGWATCSILWAYLGAHELFVWSFVVAALCLVWAPLAD